MEENKVGAGGDRVVGGRGIEGEVLQKVRELEQGEAAICCICQEYAARKHGPVTSQNLQPC